MIRPGSAPVSEGDLLAGKYRVERVLGAGGMGIVVAARHEQLDQMVAIKFVRDEALDNEEAVQRFLREARAAVKLKSEHVARVLDVGKLDSGAPYMVMEYLEGNDLGHILTEQGPMDPAAATDWILQACEAVAEAHAAGIVHRDLKPENLFLTNTVGGTQKIKVLDFGVSKSMGGASGELSNLTRTRAMLGSPLYMAPEQMRSSRDVDARADVWALGVVLFQLLTQRWPFEADTMPELCLRVVTEAPAPLGQFRPDAPPGLAAVLERCVEKDPAKRYANAAELATALEEFAPPESRFLAERARLAMEPRLPGESRASRASRLSRPMSQLGSGSTPRGTTPRGTLKSGETPVSARGLNNTPPSTTPVSATPGISASWGKVPGGSGAVVAVAGRSRTPLVVGALVAGVVGIAILAFALRGAGASASAPPAGPAVATIPPLPSTSVLPAAANSPTRLAEPAELPAAVNAASAANGNGAAAASQASAGLMALPRPIAVSPPRNPAGSAGAKATLAPPGAPRVAGGVGKASANGQDDDIPTIR